MFEALTEYMSRPGVKRPSDRALLRWIDGQRRLKHQGRLSPERQQRLEMAGVKWSLREVKWESRFEQLCSYRRLHGDCRVPMGTAKYAGLARWISAQRADFLNGRLEKSKRSRLEEIGFVWRASTHRPEPAKSSAPNRTR
jgi:hypothetical protein